MNGGKRPETGLFAGTETAIRAAFGLGATRRLRQRTALLEIAARPLPVDSLVEFARTLYRIMSGNLGNRQPSRENWRWKTQTSINDANDSPEVVLERAVAMLAERGHLPRWRNQIPVASGLVDAVSDRRAAVDLACMTDAHLDLYELKWASDTPVYAAFEILRYGLAYVLCRRHGERFGYVGRETMLAQSLGLNVLAPAPYYERLDLRWLQAGLDAGIRDVCHDHLGPEFQASFHFRVFPADLAQPFTTGKMALEECFAEPPSFRALALVRALDDLARVYPTGIG